MHDEEIAASPLVREHDIGPRGSVVVGVGSNDVRVRGVDGTVVRLVAPAADHPAIEVSTGPGSYGIHVGRAIRGRGFGFRLGSLGLFGLDVGGGTVELEVPHDARLEISAGSGDVSVRDVTGSVAVRTVSGDVSLRGGGGELRMEGASGNLRAVATAPIAATVRTVSGDVEIDAPRTERTNITTVSGDVEIASSFAPAGDHVVNTTSGDVDLAVDGGLTIEVRTVSGDVDCAHPDRRAGNGRRDPMVIGDGAARLAVRTLSGDVEVRAGRVHPERTGAPNASVQDALPRPATPPFPLTPARPPMPPIFAFHGADAEPTPPDPANTLAILEALARGEIDVTEAERRLGGGARDG
ncbi:MAG TPA: DUF4097 family beta strand repeat-containing protein [Candidatus Limnocylindrales bacterium]